jgi:hypothetical protein
MSTKREQKKEQTRPHPAVVTVCFLAVALLCGRSAPCYKMKNLLILLSFFVAHGELLGGDKQWCSDGTITQTTVCSSSSLPQSRSPLFPSLLTGRMHLPNSYGSLLCRN